MAGMISPASITSIRDRTDLVGVIGETVKLTRKGKSYLGLCPFHQEKSPSFTVNPDKGFYFCFGCKASGSAFDFLMQSEGLTFPEAARRLAERAGVEVEETGTNEERREAESAKRAESELYAANSLAAHWFETQLEEHPDARWAREELARRELDDSHRETLQEFRLGYAPLGWEGLTQYFLQQGVSPVTAQKVGLIAPRKVGSGFYDWFRHRLMFAVIDVQGRVVGFSGRALPDIQTGTVDKQTPKYVNSPESPVYQKGQTLFGLYQARQAIRQQDEAVLVEGNFDVVSLHARGVQNVVAPLGTAFTSSQAKLLRRYAPEVVLFFDGDAAGRKATRDARPTCKAAGLAARVASLPSGRDPDDLVRARGAAAVQGILKEAPGILEYLIKSALDEGFARGDAHERAARVRDITTLLAEEDDPTVRGMAQRYADTIAQRLDLTDATSFRQLQATVNSALLHKPAVANEKPSARSQQLATTGSQGIALSVLGAFLDYPELIDEAEGTAALDLLEGDVALAVAAMRQIEQPRAKMRNGLYAAEFLALLPPSLHTFAAQRLAAPYEEKEGARVELVKNTQKLRGRGAQEEKARVVSLLHKIERNADPAAEDALLRELQRREREKRGL